jgi:hypothetical protein
MHMRDGEGEGVGRGRGGGGEGGVVSCALLLNTSVPYVGTYCSGAWKLNRNIVTRVRDKRDRGRQGLRTDTHGSTAMHVMFCWLVMHSVRYRSGTVLAGDYFRLFQEIFGVEESWVRHHASPFQATPPPLCVLSPACQHPPVSPCERSTHLL